MKEEISQQRCTVGAHGYTNNLPENRASKTNVDVIDKKVNSETKLSTGEVRVPRWRLIIRPEGAKIIGSNEAFSFSIKYSLQKIMKSTKVTKELFPDWEQTDRTCGIITRLEINYQFHLSTYCLDHFCFRSMYNKTIIIFGFCDIQNNQGLGKGYHLQPSAVFGWLITPTSTLIILDITKTSSNNCLLLVLRPSISSLQSATSEGHKCYYKVRWRVMCDRYYKVRQNRSVFKSSLIIIIRAIYTRKNKTRLT